LTPSLRRARDAAAVASWRLTATPPGVAGAAVAALIVLIHGQTREVWQELRATQERDQLIDP
jgi:hypothetical protein